MTLGDREVASNENSPTVTDTVLKGGDLVGGAAVARAPVVRCGLTKYGHRSVQSIKCLATKGIVVTPAGPDGSGVRARLSPRGLFGAELRVTRALPRRQRPAGGFTFATVVRLGERVASVW